MPAPSSPDANETALNQQTASSLSSARRNLHYLVSPSSAGHQSIRLRTRFLLRSLHYLGQFLLWRLVRYAKYIAVGSLVAAVSATALGGIITPLGWIAAPPTMAASIVAASVWGAGKFVARRLHDRWLRDGGTVGERVRVEVEDRGIMGDGRVKGVIGGEVGPAAVPW